LGGKALIISWTVTVAATFDIRNTNTIERITDFTAGTIAIIVAAPSLLTDAFDAAEQNRAIGIGPTLADRFTTALDTDIACRTRVRRIAFLRCSTKTIKTILPCRTIAIRSAF
jgi:hypothetical protein